MRRALRAALEAPRRPQPSAACTGRGADGAGGVASMPGRRAAGPAAAGDPSSGGGRGVVADPGAGPCGGWAGAWRRAGRPSLPPRGTSFRRWAQRLAAHARRCRRVAAELPFWQGMLSEPALLLVRRRARCRRATRCGTRRASDADAARGGDGGAADAGAGGVPWRHQRRAADRACGCGGGLVPAARPRAAAGGAAGSRGPRPRGGVRGVDLSRTVGWFTSLYPVRLDAGAVDLDEALAGGAALGRALKRIKEQLRAVPGQGAWLRAAALPERARRRAQLAGLCGAAAWLQLPGPVCRRRRRGLERRRPEAEALARRRRSRRCRWRTRSRSTR